MKLNFKSEKIYKNMNTENIPSATCLIPYIYKLISRIQPGRMYRNKQMYLLIQFETKKEIPTPKLMIYIFLNTVIYDS